MAASEACRLLGIAQDELVVLLEFMHGLGSKAVDFVPSDFAAGLLTLFGRSGVMSLLERIREAQAVERTQAA